MAGFVDRTVSALTYFTCGIFGIIWIIYVNFAKKPLSNFNRYNIFQSILVSLIFALFSYLFGIINKIGLSIPILGKIIEPVNLFFNGTPIYFGYSISGLIIVIIIGYLMIMSLLGKKPYIPVISEAIQANTGV